MALGPSLQDTSQGQKLTPFQCLDPGERPCSGAATKDPPAKKSFLNLALASSCIAPKTPAPLENRARTHQLFKRRVSKAAGNELGKLFKTEQNRRSMATGTEAFLFKKIEVRNRKRQFRDGNRRGSHGNVHSVMKTDIVIKTKFPSRKRGVLHQEWKKQDVGENKQKLRNILFLRRSP